MKYLLSFMLCFWSTLAFSQTDIFLEENELVSYSIKKDSFTIFRDNDKTKDKKYIGLAIILSEKMGNQRVFQSTYKLLAQNCALKDNVNLLRISDYDTIVHDSYDVDLSKKNLFTSIVKNICGYHKQVLKDPNKNKNSIQNLIEYASSSNEEDWSEILYVEKDEITTLPKSIVIEN